MPKIEKFIVFKLTGVCKIERDNIVSNWDDKCFISQWKDEYRLCRLKYKYVRTKALITKEDAEYIIKSVPLTPIKSDIYTNGTTWRKNIPKK